MAVRKFNAFRKRIFQSEKNQIICESKSYDSSDESKKIKFNKTMFSDATEGAVSIPVHKLLEIF